MLTRVHRSEQWLASEKVAQQFRAFYNEVGSALSKVAIKHGLPFEFPASLGHSIANLAATEYLDSNHAVKKDLGSAVYKKKAAIGGDVTGRATHIGNDLIYILHWQEDITQ